MKQILKLIIYAFFFFNFLYAEIVISKDTKEIVLLNKSAVFFDRSNTNDIHSLMQKPELFELYHQEYINRGLDNKYPAWVKFTLVNNSSKSVQRTLSIDDIQVENIELYTTQNNRILDIKKSGSLHREEFRGILMPHFTLNIPAHEKITYYLKVFTPSYALSFKALITTQEEFIYKDVQYHLIWAVFISILFSVFVYNLFLFILTKDSIYAYYSLYVLGILATSKVHYLIWLHIFPMHELVAVETEISLIVYYTNFTSLTMVLFTQQFLQTKQYPKLHKFLHGIIVVIVLHSLVTTPTFLNYQQMALFYLLLLFFLFFVGIYTLYKKNQNAYYFVFGWSLSIFAWASVLLHGLNIWSIKYDFFYSTETLLTIEVFLFSFAISKYIRKLSEDKEVLSQELIWQKENENIKLEQKVEEKTKHLNAELKKNQFLLQELNHRVKNNMQFITSLYALKLENTHDSAIKEKLQDVERKVLAMSRVHQMLYAQKNLDFIQADEYFKTIIKNIQESFDSLRIQFIYDIQINLELEEAIYCGLIINELVTNAIKYAFENNQGEIMISLYEDDNFKYLKVKDDGIGIQKNDTSGFGQTLIQILAVEQLNGKINTTINAGTQIEISFPKK